MKEVNIVIVGGGPMGTYALERLSVLLAAPSVPVRISLFERTGRFGAGEVHSDVQPTTSYMNRIVSQISFAADESNLPPSKLLPKSLRPTFEEWCRARYMMTGDRRFDLDPRSVPLRSLHGMALRDMFEGFAARLRQLPGVLLDLYDCEVVDVLPELDGENSYQIVTDIQGLAVTANYILFVTGHAYSRPRQAKIPALEPISRPSRIAFPYPLESQLNMEVVPPGSNVGIKGLGLTAIDIALFLTEGRGGRFVYQGNGNGDPDPADELTYLPSGREPARLIGFSPSGLLPCCRPDNLKQVDLARFEHRGRFFTLESVRTLRQRFGVRVRQDDGRLLRQLDFERQVFPLVILEMGYLYYRTLFGPLFGDDLARRLEPVYQNFLSHPSTDAEVAIAALLAPADVRFEQVATYIETRLHCTPIPSNSQDYTNMAVLEAFLAVVYGPDAVSIAGLDDVFDHAGRTTLTGQSTNVWDHRFNWRRILHPLNDHDYQDGETWRARLLAFLKTDYAYALQNNLNNPIKSACDGVWRDLRSVFAEAADRGGLLPEQEQWFIAHILRYANRLTNGGGLEPTRKIIALIESGLLDVTIGPLPDVSVLPDACGFRIIGTRTGVVRDVDMLIEARVPFFDAEADPNPLYPNLLRRGLVRKWQNPGSRNGRAFKLGGLDLSEQFHPRRRDGSLDPRMTFLGAPADGLCFFQSSAARPGSGSSVLNTIAAWATELVSAIETSAVPKF